MKLRDVIKYLQEQEKKVGNVELHCISSDGKSSWVSSYNPKLSRSKDWPSKEYIWSLNHEGW